MAGTGRITTLLDSLKEEKRSALVPFFSVGDPTMEISEAAVTACCDAGADLVELGVPFSDPIADGSVIQASSQRAIAAGSTLPRVLDTVQNVRRSTETPMVLFGYYNPFFRYGERELAAAAARSGVDGILCTDLPPEEAAGFSTACQQTGVDNIFLLAPTSDDARIDAVAKMARGFVYLVAVTGVTGARTAAPKGIRELCEKIRDRTGLPVGVGFGISDADQVAEVAEYADLVVVGSALVRTMYEAGPGGAVEAARRFVGDLREGIERAAGRGS